MSSTIVTPSPRAADSVFFRPHIDSSGTLVAAVDDHLLARRLDR